MTDGSMYQTLGVHRRRVTANPDLYRILVNTAYELDWIDAGQWLELSTRKEVR